jgi:putative tryptophan/tyrosine transport system substrate-binding protein
LAILANIGSLIGMLEMREVGTAARALGLEVTPLEIQKAEEIEPVFASLKSGADELYVVTDPVVNSNRVRINSLALAARLPTLHAEKAYVQAGGLIPTDRTSRIYFAELPKWSARFSEEPSQPIFLSNNRLGLT